MTAVLYAGVLTVIAMIVRWSVVAEKFGQEDFLGGLFTMRDEDDLSD